MPAILDKFAKFNSILCLLNKILIIGGNAKQPAKFFYWLNCPLFRKNYPIGSVPYKSAYHSTHNHFLESKVREWGCHICSGILIRHKYSFICVTKYKIKLDQENLSKVAPSRRSNYDLFKSPQICFNCISICTFTIRSFHCHFM